MVKDEVSCVSHVKVQEYIAKEGWKGQTRC